MSFNYTAINEIDLLSTTWTKGQLIAWKELVDTMMCSVALTLCVVAQILFYKFPRLRVFPRSLLSWVNLLNLFYMIVMLIKWSPQSVLHDSWVRHLVPGTPICTASIFLDNVGAISPVCVTLLLCLTLFLRIVLRIDIEGKSKVFWAYLTFAVGYSVIVASFAAFANPQTASFGVCVMGNGGAVAIKFATVFVFVVQIVLFLITVFYIKRVFASVNRSTATTNFPMSYLAIRFGIMFFSQMYGLIPTQVALLFPVASFAKNAMFNRLVPISRFSGVMLDALVLIFGNVDFVDWVQTKYRQRFGTSQTTTESPKEAIEMVQRRNVECIEEGTATQDDEEKTHLSTSSEKMGISNLPGRLSIRLTTSLEDQESSDVGKSCDS